MAILIQGIMGPFRGKCGDVIGYVRNGVACVRSMPRYYHDRKSVAQLKNRNRFTMIMKAMSAVRPVVEQGFGRYAATMTEMNVATRENYYRLVEETESGMEYRYDRMVLSRGPIETLGGVTMVRRGSENVLMWDVDDLGVRGGEQDEVTVVLMNADRMKTEMKKAQSMRGDGMTTVSCPAGWEGEEVHCYVMIEREGCWSDSQYVGSLRDTADERSLSCTISNFDMTQEELMLGVDQSAIKELSEKGQSGGEKGLRRGRAPGGD